MTSIFPYIHIPIYKLSSNFVVEAFGLLVALGVICGAILARRRAEALKLDVNIMIDSFFFVIPGGFILAHWVALFGYYPERILKDPMQLLYFWAGLSSYGGLLGGLIVAMLYFKARKVPMRPYMEVLAWGLIPGFTLGRLGCTVAHDHRGLYAMTKAGNNWFIGAYKGKSMTLPYWNSPTLWIAIFTFALVAGLLVSMIKETKFLSKTTFGTIFLTTALLVLAYPLLPEALRSLAIPYPHSSFFNANYNKIGMMLIWGDGNITVGAKTVLVKTRLMYDLGLIEFMFYMVLIAGLAILLSGRPRREGTLFAIWYLTYPPVRFLLDFLRADDTTIYGWTAAQYLSVVMFGIGLYFYATLPKRRWGEYTAPISKKQKPAEVPA